MGLFCMDIENQLRPYGILDLCLGCMQREAQRRSIHVAPYQAGAPEPLTSLPELEETYDDSSEFANTDKGEQNNE